MRVFSAVRVFSVIIFALCLMLGAMLKDHLVVRDQIAQLQSEANKVLVFVPQDYVYAFQTDAQCVHELHLTLDSGTHKVDKSAIENTNLKVHKKGEKECTAVSVDVGSGDRRQTLTVYADFEVDARNLPFFDKHSDAQSPLQNTSYFRDALERISGPMYAAEVEVPEFNLKSFAQKLERAWNDQAGYGQKVCNMSIQAQACY